MRIATLALAVGGWGCAFEAIRAAGSWYPPGELALLRYLIATAIFFAVWRATGGRLPTRRDLWVLWPAALLGMTFNNRAPTWVSVSARAAAMLVATRPIITALPASVILRERISWPGWAGVALGFSGAVIIGVAEGDGASFDPGLIFVAIAAVSQPIYFVLQRPLLRRYRALDVTAVVSWLATIPPLFLLGLVATVPRTPLSPTLAVVFVGRSPALWPTARSRSRSIDSVQLGRPHSCTPCHW